MCSYYLVDYENVGTDGFNGAEQLSCDDVILVFYTNNAKKIDLDVLMLCKKARMEVVKVPVGKQSTDMHIGTYIGFLIGKNREDNSKYSIISKDTDYDGIIQFWRNEWKIEVSRCEQIGDKKSEYKKEKSPSNKNVHTDLNSDIQQALSKSGYSNDVISYVASISVKNNGTKNGKQLTYRSIIAKYGQARGLNIYTVIKKII